MRRRLIATILCLLFCANVGTSASYAQESDSDLSSAGWTGDLELFRIKEGLITYKDDGHAGRAKLFKHYERGGSDLLYWEFRTQFDAAPTSSNTFVWTLFYERSGSELYAYCIEPDARGTSLLLSRHRSDETYSTYSSRQVLTSIPLGSPAVAWSGLSIQAVYVVGDGLKVSATPPSGATLSTDPVSLTGAELIPMMALHTHFSSQKKLAYAWGIPTVSTSLGSDSSQLSYTDLTIYDEGRILIQLDRPVRIDRASATASGTPGTLSIGQSTRELVLTLPFAFMPGMNYSILLQNLIDLSGAAHDLSFDLGVESTDPDKPEADSNGLFITEVMASPPETGPLRGGKYIELYNNTSETIPLQALQLRYKSQTFRLPSIPLAPYSYALLYPLGAPRHERGVQVAMTEYPALSGSFVLRLEEITTGRLLDQVAFSSATYGEGVPVGGASVERVAFSPAEWRRSESAVGGTPGMPSSMTPHLAVPPGAILINELMLSPEPTGEKYLELYNPSDKPIELSHLYLTYRNSPSAAPKSWLLVTGPKVIPPGGYAVLCPYPEALPRIHRHTDPETYIERIDFPAFGTTYTEIDLISHKGHTLIDHATYRRQWLGDTSAERNHSALERLSAESDGRQKTAWARSSVGGTPGVHNLPMPQSSTSPEEWPDNTDLSLDQLMKLAPLYTSLLHVELYDLVGQCLIAADKKEALTLLKDLTEGKASLPTVLFLIRATITPTETELDPLTYTDKWVHTPGL